MLNIDLLRNVIKNDCTILPVRYGDIPRGETNQTSPFGK